MGGSRTALGRGRGAALVVGLALALGAAGCGGSDEPSGPTAAADAAVKDGAQPLGEQLGGSVAPLADCGDWVGGARERKLATIADIRGQLNRRDTGIDSPALTDDEAMMLFDRACTPTYAKGFRLYVLYARSAGFAPLLRDPEPQAGSGLGGR